MPLDKSGLASELEAIFKDQLSSPAIVAQKMATAYDNYCQKGLAGGAKPILVGKKALEGTLAAAIASPATGAPPTLAGAWSAGIQAYWLAPPVVFATPPISGLATTMPGAGAVVAALTAAFVNVANTEASIAQIMATTLDIATKTVLVTFTTPPPPAGPPPPATVL